MNVDQIKSAVQNMQNELSKLKLPQNIGSQLQGTFGKLTSEIEKFQSLSANGIGSTKDFNQLASSGNKILQIYNQLTTQVKNLGGLSDSQIQKLFPSEIQANIEKASKAMNDYGQATKNSQKEAKNLELEISSAQKEVEKLIKDKEKLEGKKTVSDSTFKQYGKDADEARAKFEKAQQELVELQTKASGYKTGRKAKGYVDLVDNQIPQKEAEIAKLEQAWERLRAKKEKALTQTQKDEALAKLTQDIAAAQGNVTQLQNKLANLKAGNPQSFNQLVSQLNQIKGINLDPATATMETVSQAVSNLSSNEMERLKQAFVQSGQVVDSTKGSFDRFGQEIDETRGKVSQLDDKMRQIDMLKSRIQYFFGLTNSIMLFRRAITSALNTVKELDATMTEAAVVTKFDVSDMWSQLPTYSRHAQDLGISINGMYQATTLYYQQGLKTNAAMQLGIETMKMAKIAGMDSTDATKAMTAALRGFNMELNEMSATKVNDVYSQLAAVTAADTNQIATAMEKTASIAASANMEFKTTAALLAQIIETTQEAPETAGTAMKTIIARFAEVKSLREKGLTSGEDEEGEIIDVNKIQTALRSVGISMEGFFSGTEGLDSVLLKLAEKWSGLDFETQRYIATMAAGSRQQSRFIAMMSDYGRTIELVGQAQNSAGASQKQFEKTQESLATSLNRLKNAWDQFQMGLANNEILKAGIDVLTKFLETINKITNGISGGNGLVKSVVSLGVTIAGLKGAGAVLNGIMASMGGVAAGAGLNLGANLKNSFKQSFGKKAAVPKVSFDAAQTKAYDASLKQLNTTMRQHEILKKQAGKTELNHNALMDLEKQKTEQLAVATGQLAAATDLNNDQAQEAVLMSAQGVSLDAAVIAAKAGVTAAELQEAVAKKFGTEATEEQIFATIHEIAAKKGQYIAINTGIMGRIEEIAMTKLGIASTLASTAAHWLETAGLKAKTAAMIASLGVLGLIIAAVGVLIALVVYLYKTAKANTLEGRMQAAAEATERAKEAAEGAKDAYDDLLSAKSEYDELQNQLDSLIKGTLEWKQALADSNAQVLELLDKYPELAKYLTRGKNGELEISEAGWDYVTEQQGQALKNTQAALIASQMSETKLSKEEVWENVKSSAKDAGINQVKYVTGTTTDGMTYAIPVGKEVNETALSQIWVEYQKTGGDLFKLDENGEYSQSLKDLAATTHQSEEEIYKLKTALADYEQALVENELAVQAYSEALLGYVSNDTSDYEYGKELVQGMAHGFAQTSGQREGAIKNNILAARDAEGNKQDARDTSEFKRIAKENGLAETSFSGDDVKDLETLYAEMRGIDPKDIEAGLKGNAEMLATEISRIQVAKDAGIKVDEVAKKMSAIEDKNTQKEYAAMIGGNANLMNKNIINKYLDTTKAEIEQIAKDLGLTKEELAANLGVSVADLEIKFEELAGNVNNAFIAAETKIKGITGTDAIPEAFNQASAGDLESYAQLLGQAVTLGSQDVISEGFNNIFEAATTEQKEKIVDMMDTFDWTKEGAGEEFIEILEQMGIDIEKIIPNGEDFCEQLKTVNALYRDFDLTSIFDAAEQGMKEAEEIAEQSELTTEQYQKFLDKGLINADQWTFNGKGWINVENGMKDLVEALKANTIATFQQTQKEAQEQVDLYEKVNPKINTYLNLSTTHQSNIELIQSGQAGGRLLEDVGVTQDEYKAWYDLNQNGAAGYNTAKSLANASINWGASSGGGSSSKYENSHDKQYNTYEKVNALLREREKLERRYDKLLKDRSKSAAELIENSKQQLANLEEQKKYQEFLQKAKLQEIKDLMSENSKYSGYVTGFDETTGTISIDWDAFERLKDSDKGSKIDDYLSELEELRDQWQEAQDTLEEIEDNTKEIRKEGRDEYLELENRLKDALVANRQKEIDKLSEINDSINDTNSKLLESMQSQIDEYRRNRDNQKTEQELEDKQRRLAYLQQDTSGANATEILNLQKEIEEGQESYTDQLIDQKISELQKQNDEAAEQRQRQIDLLQDQLDYDEENGKFWPEVSGIMKDVINGNSAFAIQLLQDAEGYKGMSEEQKQDFNDEFGMQQKSSAHYEAVKNLPEEKETKEEKTSGSGKIASLPESTNLSKDDIKNLQDGLNQLHKDGHLELSKNLDVDGIYGPKTKEAVALLQRKIGASADGIWGPDTRNKFLGSNLSSYKTGGLADFTGPAWLDGTKSKPEYILNADQTRAFFTLVDVLTGLTSKGMQSTQNNGDTNYDIDINVESIGNDYDVEQLASKIKGLINEDARYRNNNAINLMR